MARRRHVERYALSDTITAHGSVELERDINRGSICVSGLGQKTGVMPRHKFCDDGQGVCPLSHWNKSLETERVHGYRRQTTKPGSFAIIVEG